MKGVDLVFIPITFCDHFYLLCFNMNTIQIDLIDSSGHKNDYKENYRGWPEIMRNTFDGYLSRVSHPRAYQIKQAKISRMEMPWQTLENKFDCGVFMMRHMETFKGRTTKDWQCGLTCESEKQQHELNDLRRKYVTTMLLHDINTSKEFIISELKDYLKMDDDVKRHLHGTARRQILQRLVKVD
ncbi:hypothetical protein L1987_65036 [Smallanthus sonchifolius]|uniref:Uncharacterized protein n=1 Tax=Smallanthus sonchifolius TaxID=185202 RepID=A0ACB9BTB8_9ASTR|nr:hypothetical protein L1987_65036 [Smallanthus sonchifolius]